DAGLRHGRVGGSHRLLPSLANDDTPRPIQGDGVELIGRLSRRGGRLLLLGRVSLRRVVGSPPSPPPGLRSDSVTSTSKPFASLFVDMTRTPLPPGLREYLADHRAAVDRDLLLAVVMHVDQ